MTPNRALNRTAQQQRCWVPLALRAEQQVERLLSGKAKVS